MKQISSQAVTLTELSATKKLSIAALMGALSALLMYLKFPVPLVPPFIEFDFTNAVDIISAFLLGPMGAVCTIVVKWLIKFILQGSQTGLVGEFSGLILNLAYALPAAVWYQRRSSRRVAILSMALGCVLTSLLAVFSNVYIMFPLYGMGSDMVVKAFSAVNPFVHDLFTMALCSLIPFNLLKTGISSVIAFALYKHISRPIRNMM